MTMKTLIRLLLLSVCLFPVRSCLSPAFGQRVAVSTNLVEYFNLGTASADASVSMARHWTAHTGGRYNPFSYDRSEGGTMQNKQRALYAGARYWSWHVYSGWWLGSKLQFQEYSTGGIRSQETREGRRVGTALSGGYSYMIGPHLDLEFGLGLWGGWDRYAKYECPVCGLTLDRGQRGFLLPDDVMIALTYIF